MTRKHEIRWYGRAGHFIAADRCRHHLHTHLRSESGRRYCVSTVGAFYVNHRDKEPETIGSERLYETMVFGCGPDGMPLDEGKPLAMKPYNSDEAADAGHAEMIERCLRDDP